MRRQPLLSVLALAMGLATTAPLGCSSPNGSEAGDADTDTDSDTDADSDSDTDTGCLTCADYGFNCWSWPDGCGGWTENCGDCGLGQDCCAGTCDSNGCPAGNRCGDDQTGCCDGDICGNGLSCVGGDCVQ